jgi:hypothetical protein
VAAVTGARKLAGHRLSESAAADAAAALGANTDAAAPKGEENANNQLCGATYIELYKLDGARNATMLADTVREFDSEIADAASVSDWSWVDALFMAMNTCVVMTHSLWQRGRA